MIEEGILKLSYSENILENLQLKAAMDAGALLIDGKARDLRLENSGNVISEEQLRSTEEAILQAARIRFSKPEYISCPGCGRTLYNLEETIARVKAATGHERPKSLSWAVVNGRARWPMPISAMSEQVAAASASIAVRIA